MSPASKIQAGRNDIENNAQNKLLRNFMQNVPPCQKKTLCCKYPKRKGMAAE
jgi:hypothetical protein